MQNISTPSCQCKNSGLPYKLDYRGYIYARHVTSPTKAFRYLSNAKVLGTRIDMHYSLTRLNFLGKEKITTTVLYEDEIFL